MKSRLISLALFLAPLGAKALDLTPAASFRDLEGFKIPIVLFSDAGKKIAFQPPTKWRISGGGDALSLYPAELPDAVMQLRVRPTKPPEPGVTEDVEKWSRTQLPQDAAEPALEGEVENVFTIGPRPSRQFTYSYASQGRRFTTSVAIVEWNARERLAVIVTARAADFKTTHETAMRSMFSWNEP